MIGLYFTVHLAKLIPRSRISSSGTKILEVFHEIITAVFRSFPQPQDKCWDNDIIPANTSSFKIF